MALITCIECGKMVSDKATICPNCGCPVIEILKERDAILLLSTSEDKRDKIKIFAQLITNYAETRKIKESSLINNRVFKDSKRDEIVKALNSGNFTTKSDSKISCPRCGSSQITTKNKGFGLGKAIVGGLLLGPVGLLGGAIGSNKTLVVCLKCGKEWKV